MSASEPLSAGRLAEYRELAAELEQARTLPGGAWKASELDEKSVLPPKDLPTQYVVEDHLATKHSLIRSSVGVFGDERHARFTAAAREALPALLAEVARLAARVARLEQSEAAGQRVIARMSREARGLEDELVRRQRRIADLADRTETAETRVAELEDRAHQFRIPLTNQVGGYGEIVVQRESSGSPYWGITDGALTGLRAWADGSWQYVSDVGRAVAYIYTLDAAMDVARQVAEIEGAAYEAKVNALRAEQAGGDR